MKRQMLPFLKPDRRAGKPKISGKRILPPSHGTFSGGYCTSVFSSAIFEDTNSISWDGIAQCVPQYGTLEQQLILFVQPCSVFGHDFANYGHEYRGSEHQNAIFVLRHVVFAHKCLAFVPKNSKIGHALPSIALPTNTQNQRMIN